MAAKGLFKTGFTVAEILAIQATAKADLLAGKGIMSYTTGGTSVSKQYSMPIGDVLAECQCALRFLDPVTYPPQARVFTRDLSGITQTL